MAQNDGPKWDMKMPMWGLVIALVAALGAYYGQRESTSIALAEIRGDMNALKKSMERIETDRYTSSDARRDFSWRDERAVEQGKRIADLEADRRRGR